MELKDPKSFLAMSEEERKKYLKRRVWSTHTGGNPGSIAMLKDDGNLVVYSATGQALWSSSKGRL
jgi:hypothetical protein